MGAIFKLYVMMRIFLNEQLSKILKTYRQMSFIHNLISMDVIIIIFYYYIAKPVHIF